jgi:hypothetical protein
VYSYYLQALTVSVTSSVDKFSLFFTYQNIIDIISNHLVGSIAQSAISPVGGTPLASTSMLPPRIHIADMSNYMLTCEKICSVWEAANPGRPSPMLNDNLCSVIRDIVTLRNGFPFLPSRPRDEIEGGTRDRDDSEVFVLGGISLVYSRTHVESISLTRRLMFPLLQTWRCVYFNDTLSSF